jgi:hypothetical protein
MRELQAKQVHKQLTNPTQALSLCPTAIADGGYLLVLIVLYGNFPVVHDVCHSHD